MVIKDNQYNNIKCMVKVKDRLNPTFRSPETRLWANLRNKSPWASRKCIFSLYQQTKAETSFLIVVCSSRVLSNVNTVGIYINHHPKHTGGRSWFTWKNIC